MVLQNPLSDCLIQKVMLNIILLPLLVIQIVSILRFSIYLHTWIHSKCKLFLSSLECRKQTTKRAEELHDLCQK